MASNPKMIIQNVAWNKKMHIYSKFGAILFTIVNFIIVHFVLPYRGCHKNLISTIVNEIAPNLE